MKIFLDANILVSVLNKEYPVFTYSSRVLSLANVSKYKLYTSPLCLAIAYYFAEKKCGNTQARHKIDLLISKLQITTVNDKTEVKSGLTGNERVLLSFPAGTRKVTSITGGGGR